eukprot:746558-Hanusia_phi.AAC.7
MDFVPRDSDLLISPAAASSPNSFACVQNQYRQDLSSPLPLTTCLQTRCQGETRNPHAPGNPAGQETSTNHVSLVCNRTRCQTLGRLSAKK